MKARSLVIILFVLSFVGSTALVGETSASKKTEFTATETFCPFPMLCNPVVGAILSPGTLTCPGHDPTGNPMQPCPPGSNLHLRGNKRLARVDSLGEPRMRGLMTVESNANWDAEFTGPIWGTFSIVLDDDLGTWDGTFQGKRTLEDQQWVTLLHATGHGSGGAIDGMQLRLVDRIVVGCPLMCPNVGNVQGYILDPHSR